MVIDTKYRMIKIKLVFMIAGMIALVVIGFLMFTDYLRGPVPAITLITVYLLFFIFLIIKKYNYIYFTDEGGKYILRYFNFIPTVLIQKSIEIPKDAFVKYVVKKSAYGMREELVLFEKTKRGVAKYPDVSISILNDEEKQQLLNSLPA